MKTNKKLIYEDFSGTFESCLGVYKKKKKKIPVIDDAFLEHRECEIKRENVLFF